MRTIDVDGVYDIETEGWDRFVMGGFLRRSGGIWKNETWNYDNEEKMVDAILAFDGTIWAHNGGRYDGLWLAEHIIKRGLHAKIGLAGQRIVSLEVNKLKVRDSFALIPFALKLASKMGGGSKQETGLPCVCSKDCGGYCSIKRVMSVRDRDKLIEYLKNDLIVSKDMLYALKEFAVEHDLDLCGTIGSSAYSTVSRELKIRPAKWRSEDYAFVRDAYYGGRTQVFRHKSHAGFRIDVNSAYIAALSKLSVPIGQRNKTESPSETQRDYESGKDGVLQCTVYVPYTHIPPLPVRTPSRLAYPVGQISGTWTTLELAYAVSTGVQILNFGRGIFWDDRETVFKDFEQRIWDIRAAAGPKTAFGQWIKWFANSQTGKFAQHPLVDVVEINPEREELETFCPASRKCKGKHWDGAPCCPHKCTRVCGIWNEVDRVGNIWSKKQWRMADCAHIEWAAFLTAYQRIYLHRQLVDDGHNGLTAVYCDTDSIYSTVPRSMDIGTGLGEWKEEGKYHNFVAIAPKTYSYFDEEGNLEAKAKGIPDAVKNWLAMQSDEGVYIDRGVESFKSAARSKNGKGLFQRKSMVRHCFGNGQWFGDRLLMEDGSTKPVTIEQLSNGQ